jgi:mono/diheme cytochrome c family protein
MKKFIRIIKWTGLALLLIIAAITIAVPLRQNLKYDAPYPNISASADSAVIARGRHLVISSAHCLDCHGNGNKDSILASGKDVDLSGGYTFELPLGKIYARNITPDKETGIGNLTDKEIARALRYGVHADGTPLFDFMPFHNTSDEDLTAIISYLRSRPAVKHKVPEHQLNAMGKAVKAFVIKPVGPSEEVPVSVKPDSTAKYGAYIVNNVANCKGCHTQRDISGKFTGPLLAGGHAFGDPGLELAPPNLTTDSSSRIFNWTQKDFMNRFRQGKLIPYSHMPWSSYSRMTDLELVAIYKYLKTVPAAKIVEKEKK